MNYKLKNEIESFLLKISKPARYCGGEINSIVKNEANFRIAISYPDLYEIGMANMGIKILYDKVNQINDIACERVFAVNNDFSDELSKKNLPLYSLETFTPLNKLDMIGFNVSHQMLYTNILQILDLGKIKLLTKERSKNDPIIIAGGEAISNPAPLEDFIDAFYLGDGETGIIEIVKLLNNLKKQNISRIEKIQALSNLESVFVPSIYKYKENDNIIYYSGKNIKRASLNKNLISDPVKPIVSTMRITQERAIVTLTRGCFNLCKFCHAGYYNLPYRAVDPQNVADRIKTILKNTGHNELSLSSLSVSDYKYLIKLLNIVLPDLIEQGIKISLPSLKVDKNTIPVIEAVSDMRKTSLTFAVETANEEIRKIIHKRLILDDLLEIVKIVYSKGWKKIKLYFMIGLPDYKIYNEAESIITLLKNISKIGNNRIKLNVTVSPFVPKPHTAFERHEMADKNYFEKTVKEIKHNVSRNISIKNHNIDASIIEGFFSRADNRSGEIILAAYKKGCNFDSWDDYFKPEIWYKILNTILPDWENTLKQYDKEINLPWSIIKTGYEKLINLKTQKILSTNDLKKLKSNYTEEININALNEARKKLVTKFVPYKTLRIIFSKSDNAKYISHLDIIEVFIRAFRMAELPVCFSQGFHKREKISSGFPLPLGIESISEIIDVDIYEKINLENILKNLNQSLPSGIKVIKIYYIDTKQSLMKIISAVEFTANIPENKYYKNVIDAIENKKILEKKTKKGIIQVTANKVIKNIEISEKHIKFIISIGKPDSIRIDNLLMQLTNCSIENISDFKITKIAQYYKDDNDIYNNIIVE